MKLKFICIVCQMAILVSACGKDDVMEDNYDNNYSLPHNYFEYSSTYDKLFNTTWALQKYVKPDGTLYNGNYLGETITFSSELYSGSSVYLKFYSSLFSGFGTWTINNNGDLDFEPTGNCEFVYDYGEDDSPSLIFMRNMGFGGEIITLNSNTLVFKKGLAEYTYSKTNYNGNQNDNNQGSGSSSSQYEKPEIGLEDYTCSTSSITVKYRIYNQSEAQVTSATGYYGTSSPSKSVTGSVSGSLITLRFTGLNKGTEYYIKCTAKGKGGSSTSETVRLSTYY